MALRKFLILRKLRSSCLEGRTPLIQSIVGSLIGNVGEFDQCAGMRRPDAQHRGKHDPGDAEEGTYHRQDHEDCSGVLHLLEPGLGNAADAARNDARQTGMQERAAVDEPSGRKYPPTTAVGTRWVG
jgi:hypothetical protein